MTHYAVRLYTDQLVKVHSTRIECGRKDIPGMLACVVIHYLKDAPYPGAMQARVIVGRRYTEYVIRLKNDALDVYRHVLRANRAEVQEHPAGSAAPLDGEEEGAAR